MDGFSEQGNFGNEYGINGEEEEEEYQYQEQQEHDDEEELHYEERQFQQQNQLQQHEQQHQQQYSQSVDGGGGGGGGVRETKHHSLDDHLDSAGKLFVGGISWETTEGNFFVPFFLNVILLTDLLAETFTNYFGKYGEITDSVIMMDRHTGRPRGFGFVTFADVSIADKVLEEEHVIDGRAVEVKRTVPREDMQVRGVSKTKKIFVGGIPPSFTEVCLAHELREYFSSYGNVVEHQIMLDHKTGRSRGFGFVTFETEDTVEKVFLEGKIHELGGKQVEIKKAEPKRAGGEWSRYGGGGSGGGGGGGGGANSYGNFGKGAGMYSGGYNPGGGYYGKSGKGYGGDYSSYGGYGNYGGYGDYGGNYAGGAAGFYGGYGGYGYGFGFGGPMYGGAAYGASGYGNPGGYSGGGAAAGNSGGKGYGGNSDGRGGGRGGRGGAATGRYHPYGKWS
ncbi:RNA recognition motif domain [Dillenia turbinata]|uniref:RNA recognition motif domain n=1 Tax=Dillenia turbinata TaxID=194707 RepID=A0AAN8US82_9MAGN